MALTRIQNDTGPPIKDRLETDGSADDLSGATVAFTMWPAGDPSSPTIDENTANVTIEPDGTGTVDYAFADDGSDLDTTGTFAYEWEVTFSNGEVITYRREGGAPKELRVLEEGS